MPFDEHNPEDNGGDHGGSHEGLGAFAKMADELIDKIAEEFEVCPFCGPVSAANLTFSYALAKVRKSSTDDEVTEFVKDFVSQALEVSYAIVKEEGE